MKVLDRQTWLSVCSSGLSVASGISSVATLSTSIGLPISILLGTVSLAGVSVSGMATILAKKYQKKLAKVIKLVDIVILALAVFKMSVSKALNNGETDKPDFATLQTLHLGALNRLGNINCKMEAETRVQLQKSLLKEINDFKKAVKAAS